MYKKTLKNICGFTLLEMILAIVIISILSIAVLGALVKPFNEQAIDFNDVKLIVNNVDDIYYSILKKYGPDPVPGFTFGIDGYTQDCSETVTEQSIDFLLCKTNDLGDNVKYTINSSVTNSSISAPPLQDIQIWNVDYSIVFYTRISTTATWNEYIAVNRTLKVPQ